VSKNRALGLLACVELVCVLGVALLLSGCQSLDGTATGGSTTTTAPAETTTTIPPPPPSGYTDATRTDPCLIIKAYSKGGWNYVVVDYIQTKWVSDGYGNYNFEILNTSTKLRTFVVPDTAELSWAGKTYDPDSPRTFAELMSIAGSQSADYSLAGFFTIQVDHGWVVKLIDGETPDDPNTYEDEDT
jgi:hypothetical protein